MLRIISILFKLVFSPVSIAGFIDQFSPQSELTELLLPYKFFFTVLIPKNYKYSGKLKSDPDDSAMHWSHPSALHITKPSFSIIMLIYLTCKVFGLFCRFSLKKLKSHLSHCTSALSTLPKFQSHSCLSVLYTVHVYIIYIFYLKEYVYLRFPCILQ